MKQTNNAILKIMLGVFFAGAFLSSCKKDVDPPFKPVITTPADGGIDSLTLGGSILLHPKVNRNVGLTYSWTVNGTQAGTDSTFTFTPSAAGDFLIVYGTTGTGGTSSFTYKFHVWSAYENGFFIISEGSYGSSSGRLAFYRYDTKKLEDSVYTKVNPVESFDPNTSTLEFGTVFNKKIYLLSKAGGPLVVADALSLKETVRIPSSGSNDFRALLGVDTSKGLLSTGNGLFPISLYTLSLGAAINGVTGETGDMIAAGTHIFVLSANDGLIILNAADYSIAQKIHGIQIGFAKSMDGAIWAASDSALVRIDPTSLATTTVPLPFQVYSSFGAWHAGSMAASATENAVFIADNGQYGDATQIYKYTGTASSVQTPFITLPSAEQTYGQGIAYNATGNQLMLNEIPADFSSGNDLVFYSAAMGTSLSHLSFAGYFFPAMTVFH